LELLAFNAPKNTGLRDPGLQEVHPACEKQCWSRFIGDPG